MNEDFIWASVISTIGYLGFYFYGYRKGWQARQLDMVNKMASDPDVMLEALMKVKMLQADKTEVYLEEAKDTVFVYNKETHQFLGQGPDIDSAMQVVCERFPDQYFFYEDESA